MEPSADRKVAVITGASSGIGRATALTLAEHGFDVVLAARRLHALQEVAREAEARGVRALAVETDVSDESQVNALAEHAVEELGRIDVWISNAGVNALGAFDEVPTKDIRQIFDTDVFGVIYGARAAMKHFKAQGRGTLINVSSVVTRMPQPYAAYYVAAKSAVRGLGASLRQELYLQGTRDIHVVTVMPGVIDTPFFQSAGNYTSREVKAPPPVNDPQAVADAILGAISRPRREVYVGMGSRMAATQMTLMPALAEKAFARMVNRFHLGEPGQLDTTGNLFTPPANDGSISGGWQVTPKPPGALQAAIVAGGVAGIVYWRRRR